MSSHLPVKILQGSRVVEQKIIEVHHNSSLNSIVDGCINRITVDSRDPKTNKVETFDISPSKTLNDVHQAIGACLKITCYLSESSHSTDAQPDTERSAFNKLMHARKNISLPHKKCSKSGKDDLYNSLIDLLVNEKLGFTPFQKCEQDLFFKIMLQTLWLLDGQQQKFSSLGSIHKIPTRFILKPPNNQLTFRVLHHGDLLKKTVPRLSKEDLVECTQNLEELCCKRFLKSEMWKEFLKDVENLKVCIDDYLNHLSNAEQLRQRPDTDSITSENRSLYKIEGKPINSLLLKATYNPLRSRLLELANYEFVNTLFFVPDDRRRSYDYIKNMQFDFDVQIYKSFRPRATFIWRLPVNSEQSDAQLALVVANIEKDLKNLVKADRLKKVLQVYSETVAWDTQKVRNVILEMTGKFNHI